MERQYGITRAVFVFREIGVHDPRDGVPENVGIVAVVEPPLELFKVTIQTLCAHLVERADERTLEQAPHAFHSVGMNVAHNPHFLGVVHGLMARVAILNRLFSDSGGFPAVVESL